MTHDGSEFRNAIEAMSDIVSPSGRRMTVNDLPPPDTKRWISHRKAEVVAGVRAGLISLEDACKRYALSIDEFLSWQRNLDERGLKGLRVTVGRRKRIP